MTACSDGASPGGAPVPTAATTTTGAQATPGPTAASTTSSTAPAASSAPAAPGAAPAEAPGPAGKILCFGDSITQADWPGKIAPEERWVTALGARSPRITTVNAGRNGRTTAEGVAELPAVLTQHPDAAYVLFFLGVNDVKHASPGVVEKAVTHMGRMIELTREKLPKAEIVLLAPIDVSVERLTPYFRDAGMGPDTPHYMSAMRTAYRTLAGKRGVRFIDLLHVVTPAHVEDGVHANGKGQLQIADAVWKGLTAAPATK